MDTYAQEVAKNTMRDIELGELEGLPEAPLSNSGSDRKTFNGSKSGPVQSVHKVSWTMHISLFSTSISHLC